MALRCYLLALTRGSSVDQVNNAFTLFNLIEGLAVSPDILGNELSIEAHIYWIVDKSARERDFEIRVVRVSDDDGQVEDAGGPLPMRTPELERVRFRTGGFRIPKAFGKYLLHVEWRPKGEQEWHREPVVWPLVLQPRLDPPTEEQVVSGPSPR